MNKKNRIVGVMVITVIGVIAFLGVVSAITGSVGVSVDNSELAVSDSTVEGGSFLEFTNQDPNPEPNPEPEPDPEPAPDPDPNTPPGATVTLSGNNGFSYPGATAAGEYTAEQIAYSTGFQEGGPFNQSGEANGHPTGLHDAPLSFVSGWSTGAVIRGDYQTFFRPTIEWRGALFTELGHNIRGDFIVQTRNSAYWAFVNGQWVKQFDANLGRDGGGGGCCGAFLGAGAQGNPFEGTNFGLIPWQDTAGGATQAPWRGNQLMHFWSGRRHPVQAGQTAELATFEVRIRGLDGGQPDTNANKVLAQIGIDYYNPGENNNRAPGPGIGRYQYLDGDWLKLAWVTTPQGTPINYDGTVNWLKNNPPPFLVE